MGEPPLDVRARAERLSDVFDLHSLLGKAIDAKAIRRYYRSSSLGYRWFHSRDGSIHMALTDATVPGRFPNFRRQMDLLLEAVGKEANTGPFLDLGCGRGYNLQVLAPYLPSCDFVGIDIEKAHVRSANWRLRKELNITILQADFQDTGLEDNSFDVLYAVESLCHATDLHAMFKELSRVAKSGAHLVVFDAWRTEATEALSTETEAALQSLERAMAVPRVTTLAEWQRTASVYGWNLHQRRDLRTEVLPNLERLERLATRFLGHKRIARTSRRIMRGPLLENVIAGYMMAESVRSGYHTYEMVTLRAAPSARRRARSRHVG